MVQVHYGFINPIIYGFKKYVLFEHMILRFGKRIRDCGNVPQIYISISMKYLPKCQVSLMSKLIISGLCLHKLDIE